MENATWTLCEPINETKIPETVKDDIMAETTSEILQNIDATWNLDPTGETKVLEIVPMLQIQKNKKTCSFKIGAHRIFGQSLRLSFPTQQVSIPYSSRG